VPTKEMTRVCGICLQNLPQLAGDETDVKLFDNDREADEVRVEARIRFEHPGRYGWWSFDRQLTPSWQSAFDSGDASSEMTIPTDLFK
jgi:hypothetical protein